MLKKRFGQNWCLINVTFNSKQQLIFDFYRSGLENLKKSKLIKKQETLLRGWKVSFKIHPFGTVNKYSSILHATIGKDHGQAGDRIPAIWFQPRSTKLYICSAVNGNKDYCYSKSSIPLHRTSFIIVQQVQSKKNYQYYYQIIINGKRILNILNKNPQVFKNVKYYAGDPWWNPAYATINHFNLAVFKHKGNKYDLCLN